MRRSFFFVGILACMLAVVAAWSKEDQEIFRLRDEVEATEGEGTTFYDFVGISPSANQDEINKGYRKRSRVLHPDKVKQQFIADKTTGKGKDKVKKGGKPGVHVSKGPSKAEIAATAKAASDRFARLGLVTNILRGPGRERYDHFLNNGFPKWKGTGYYYARFRPGLGTVLTALFFFVGGGGHWLMLYTTWRRQQDFVGRYVRFARQQAWGDSFGGIPGLDGTATPPVTTGTDDVDPMAQPLNRRQRRMQEKDSKKDKSDKKSKSSKRPSPSPAGTPVGVTGAKKRVVAENGKVLVVDAIGNVYVEQQDEDGNTQEFLLDPNEIPFPTWKDTAVYRLPVWVINRSTSRLLGKAPAEDESSEEGGEATPSSSDAEDYELLEKSKTAPNGTGKTLRRNKKSGRGK